MVASLKNSPFLAGVSESGANNTQANFQRKNPSQIDSGFFDSNIAGQFLVLPRIEPCTGRREFPGAVLTLLLLILRATLANFVSRVALADNIDSTAPTDDLAIWVPEL